MIRVLLLVAVAVWIGSWLLDGPAGSSRVRTEGRAVVVATRHLEARFDRLAPHGETYMLFGGSVLPGSSAVTDVGVAGLPWSDAQLISREYPDFTSCRSPGAENAKRLVRDLSLVASRRGVRRELARAVELHDAAIRRGGDRVCLRVSGERLSFDSVRAHEPGLDLPSGFVQHLGRQEHVLVDEAEAVECRTLL